MEQGMTRSKMHATEEHRGGRMEARERRHSSMKDARSSGEQAEATEPEIGGGKIHASGEGKLGLRTIEGMHGSGEDECMQTTTAMASIKTAFPVAATRGS